MLDLDQRISRRQLLTAAGVGLGALVLNTDVLVKGFVDAISRFYSTDKPYESLLTFGSKTSLVAASDYQTTVEQLINLFTPAKAEAALETAQIESGMIMGRQVFWRSGDWGPIFPYTALKLNLPRIHDRWWPAHALDLEGIPGDIQEQSTRMANTIMRSRPETAGYAGHCPWLASAEFFEAKPQAYPGENYAGAENKKKIVRLKQGALVIAHSGDIFVPIPATKEVLTPLVLAKQPLVVNLPTRLLGAGDWYRALQGISKDGTLVRVTDFGNPNVIANSPAEEDPVEPADVNLPRSGITSAWIVYPADSTGDFVPRIKKATSFWRYNIDRAAIRRKVYPQTS